MQLLQSSSLPHPPPHPPPSHTSGKSIRMYLHWLAECRRPLVHFAQLESAESDQHLVLAGLVVHSLQARGPSLAPFGLCWHPSGEMGQVFSAPRLFRGSYCQLPLRARGWHSRGEEGQEEEKGAERRQRSFSNPSLWLPG